MANKRTPEGMRKKILYDIQYRKTNYREYRFQVRKDDTEIIEKLESVPNRKEYLVDLIREDIYKHKA